MYEAQRRTTIGLGVKTNDSGSQRPLGGFGITILGPVVTSLIQFASAPSFLHSCGASEHGDWLLLSATPSCLPQSDLGGGASGSDMSMRVAAEYRKWAFETFQSSWVPVAAVSLVALALACASVSWIPWQSLLMPSGVSHFQAARVLLVFVDYVVISQQTALR